MLPESPSPEPNDHARIKHMLVSALDAIKILDSRDTHALAVDMVGTRALVNCFTEIGEAASKISQVGKDRAGDLPWRKIVGMRNIVVHTYWGIDLNELVQTVKNDLPMLADQLKKVLDSWPE